MHCIKCPASSCFFFVLFSDLQSGCDLKLKSVVKNLLFFFFFFFFKNTSQDLLALCLAIKHCASDILFVRTVLTFYIFLIFKYQQWLLIVCQELQPVVGDLQYAVLHSMLLIVNKTPGGVQRALKNFVEILSVDVRMCHISA